MTCRCYCINMQNGFTALHILYAPPVHLWGFPHGSVGKESSRNAGDPCSIPGLGRSPGEGIGYPLQYSWASLMAQLVKNLPAMWETWVWSLGWEGPPGEGKGYPLQYSGLENSMDCPWDCKESDTTERLSHFYMLICHLYIFFDDICVKVFVKVWKMLTNLLNWVVSFLIVEFWELFMYFG